MRKILVSSALFLAVLAGCGGKPTEDNYAKVKTGMTSDEVEGILGKADSSMDTPIANMKSWNVPGGSKKILISFANGKVETMTLQ